MQTITLTADKPEYLLEGREDKMSAEILKVTLKELPEQPLKLNVFDGNGFLLYAKLLIPEPKHPNTVLESPYPEIAVNKRFIFSAFLKVQLEAPAGSSFLVEVHFV